MALFIALLLALSPVVQAQGDNWCGSGSNLCGTTGKQLTDLSCGWCRDWTLTSNIAGNVLRLVGIDGGALPGDGSNQHNYMAQVSLTSTLDLNDLSAWKLVPLPTIVPNLRDGAFWSKDDNSTIYLFGGHAPSETAVPSNNALPQLDVSTQKWTTPISDVSIGRSDAGAYVNVPGLQAGFYIGGFQSNHTSTLVTDGMQHYTTSMIIFNTTTASPSTVAVPFGPIQHGAVTYLPYGPRGILVFFGGESPSTATVTDCKSCTVQSWDHVWIYDIAANQWHRQNTAGYMQPRSEFCISTAYDQQSRSWQVWTMGGLDISSQTVLSSVAVLSIPSFQWFNATSAAQRMSVTCQTVGSQVFVIGGRTENSAGGGQNYDSPAYIYDINKQATALSYNPSSTTYAAPSSIRAALSTSSTPSSWADSTVQALFVTASASASASASGMPSSSSNAVAGTTGDNTSSSSGSSGLSGGAIGGIVVGAIALLAIIVLAIWFWRRRKARKTVDDSRATNILEKAELEQPEVSFYYDHKQRPTELEVPHERHLLAGGYNDSHELDGKDAKGQNVKDSVVYELEGSSKAHPKRSPSNTAT